MCDVEHAEVLYVGPFTDPNVVHIASDHGIEPDTALFPHDDVTDHNGCRFDKTGLWNRGLDTLKGANHDAHSRELLDLPQGAH